MQHYLEMKKTAIQSKNADPANASMQNVWATDHKKVFNTRHKQYSWTRLNDSLVLVHARNSDQHREWTATWRLLRAQSSLQQTRAKMMSANDMQHPTHGRG